MYEDRRNWKIKPGWRNDFKKESCAYCEFWCDMEDCINRDFYCDNFLPRI